MPTRSNQPWSLGVVADLVERGPVRDDRDVGRVDAVVEQPALEGVGDQHHPVGLADEPALEPLEHPAEQGADAPEQALELGPHGHGVEVLDPEDPLAAGHPAPEADDGLGQQRLVARDEDVRTDLADEPDEAPAVEQLLRDALAEGVLVEARPPARCARSSGSPGRRRCDRGHPCRWHSSSTCCARPRGLGPRALGSAGLGTDGQRSPGPGSAGVPRTSNFVDPVVSARPRNGITTYFRWRTPHVRRRNPRGGGPPRPRPTPGAPRRPAPP